MFKISSKQLVLALCIAGGAISLSSCSKDDDASKAETIEIGGNNVKISLTAENFNSDVEDTRTVNTTTQTVELGNDLTAEITLHKDRQQTTRAPKEVPDGHYTIYAVNPATGQRITGTRKLLKGRFHNGQFIKESGNLTLAAGTYKFVCVCVCVCV